MYLPVIGERQIRDDRIEMHSQCQMILLLNLSNGVLRDLQANQPTCYNEVKLLEVMIAFPPRPVSLIYIC